jgi:transposase
VKKLKPTSPAPASGITPDKPCFEANAAYLGIDVSKEYFDAALCLAQDRLRNDVICERFSNDAKGIKGMDKWLMKQGVDTSLRPHLLVVMENTGIYHRRLWQYCCDQELHATIGNAADIKWSFGLVRGKDDLTDSIRLCEYAYRHADRLIQAPAFDQHLLLLKDLQTLRRRLLRHLGAHRTALGELSSTNTKATQAIMERASKAAIDGIKKSLQQVDDQIKSLIRSNDAIRKNYRLLLSVPGIGPVTAVYLICCTGNFIGQPTGKQLACYAGVAPFAYSSGRSVKGRTQVSKMANKELKKLLHMGARSVATHNKEASIYYRRKAAEGKHDLSIINAIKNKILLRVASVIRKGEPYVDKLAIAA